MSPTAHTAAERPRELRRRVRVPARVRASGAWADACILNVSSRGLMINAARPSSIQGNTIELWHGNELVVATIVWRKGTRAGLRSEGRVPVEEILAGSGDASLQLTAVPATFQQPRVRSAAQDFSRLRGRALEFGAIVLIAASLAAGAFQMVESALARPMVAVRDALPG